MKFETLEMDAYDIQSKLAEKDSYFYKTDIEFLKSHKGWRKGKVHTFLGAAGAGKSTLMRTIIKDFNNNNIMSKMAILLSEETIQDLKMEWSKVPSEELLLSNVVIASQLDAENNNKEKLKKDIIDYIGQTDPALLLFDNITTSMMYEGYNNKDQSEIMQFLKQIAIKFDIPVVIFAHTDAKINENINRLINMNDIRGSKAPVNYSEFFYILQRFEIGERYFPTLRITKYRGHEVPQRLYYLDFCSISFTFKADWTLPWDEFKGAYASRNTL